MAHARAGLQIGRLTWFDRDSNSVDPGLPEGAYTDFRLSPDEKRLSSTLVNTKTGQPEIWLTDIDRGNSSRFAYAPTLILPQSGRLMVRDSFSGRIGTG
jgi:hypothetical protein